MDHDRERALTLAQEAEPREGFAPAEQIIARAEKYLRFLKGEVDFTASQALPMPQG